MRRGLGLAALLACVLSACSSSAPGPTSSKGGSTGTAGGAHLTPPAAAALSAAVASPNPKVRQGAVIPQLAAQIGASPILPEGDKLSIAAGSFHPLSPNTGTVTATSSGLSPGTWVLYLVSIDGKWHLAEATPAGS